MISYVYKLVCIKEFFLDSSHCMHAFETKKLLRFLFSKIYHTASCSNAVLNIGHRILPLSFFFVGDNKLTNTISLRYQSLQSVQTLIDWQDSSQGLHALCSFWFNKVYSVLWHIGGKHTNTTLFNEVCRIFQKSAQFGVSLQKSTESCPSLWE